MRFGLQLRLLDRFGDNGIIAIVIGRTHGTVDVSIDTWLMSCRVLGRGVERHTLNLLAEQALRSAPPACSAEYVPTKKNGMVRDHYAKLGFTVQSETRAGSIAVLDLADYTAQPSFIHVTEGPIS